jgi:hypothetical protein
MVNVTANMYLFLGIFKVVIFLWSFFYQSSNKLKDFVAHNSCSILNYKDVETAIFWMAAVIINASCVIYNNAFAKMVN